MDVEYYARFLSHLPIFKGLSPREIAEIARAFEMRPFKEGDLFCVEGEPANDMYVIERGSVDITKRTQQGDEQVLTRLVAPTIVGEMALLDSAPRSATVRAASPCVAYRLDPDAFNLLRRHNNTAAYKVIRNLAITLCTRLRETNQRIDQFFADPEQSLKEMQQRQQKLWRERQQRRGGEA